MIMNIADHVHYLEEKAIIDYLSKNVATLPMVAASLGILLPQVCLHKIELQLQGLLIVLYCGKCEECGSYLEYLTTDPKLVKKIQEWTDHG